MLQIDDNNDNIENNNNYMEKDSCNEEIILSCGIYYSLFMLLLINCDHILSTSLFFIAKLVYTRT